MHPPFDLAAVEAPFFEPLIGQKFLAHFVEAPDEPPLELELFNVHPLHHRPDAGARAPFSLLFRSPGDPARLRQGTYEIVGTVLVREPIFLVPIRDPLRGGVCMEAVFN